MELGEVAEVQLHGMAVVVEQHALEEGAWAGAQRILAATMSTDPLLLVEVLERERCRRAKWVLYT